MRAKSANKSEVSKMEVYAVYSWVVKRGRGEEFVAAWQNFAKWIVKQEGSTGSTRLFRNTLDLAHYMSVDVWKEGKASETIRTGVEFGRQYYKLQQLTDNFSSWSFKLEAEQQP